MTADQNRVPLDAVALLEVLERHQVAYVVIGGYAAELRGSVRRTVDIDVVPRTTADNLERLADALRELRARIRTDDDSSALPFATSAEALRGMSMLNLVTAHGELDLNFTPTGTTGYEDLHTDSTTFSVGRVQVQVASLAAVIRSKTAAGRGKDLDALPELHRLAGVSNEKRAIDAPPHSAPERAQADHPAPADSETTRELARARIDAARRQLAATRSEQKRPPTPQL